MKQKEQTEIIESYLIIKEKINKLQFEIEKCSDVDEKAKLSFELGEIFELEIVNLSEALKYYQQSFKLDSKSNVPLKSARKIYNNLCKLNMVAQLINMELKVFNEIGQVEEDYIKSLYFEMGEALSLIYEKEKARLCYERILQISSGDVEAKAILEDLEIEEGWEEKVNILLRNSQEIASENPKEAVKNIIKAINIERFFDVTYNILQKHINAVIQLDPENEKIWTIWECIVKRYNNVEEIKGFYKKYVEYSDSIEQKQQRLYDVALKIMFDTDDWNGLKYLTSILQLNGQNNEVIEKTQFKIISILLEEDEKQKSLQYINSLFEDDNVQGETKEYYLKLNDFIKGIISETIATIDKEEEKEMGHKKNNNGLQTKGIEPKGESDSSLKISENDFESSHIGEQLSQLEGKVESDSSVEKENSDNMESGSKIQEAAKETKEAAEETKEAAKETKEAEETKEAAEEIKETAEEIKETAEEIKETTVEEKEEPKQSPELISALQAAKALQNDPPFKRIEAWKNVLKIDSQNIEAIDNLIEIYTTLNRLPDLVKMKKSKADALTDKEERINLYLEVATLFMEKFSNQAEATKSLEAVIQIDPLNKEALNKLKELYEKRRDWGQLFQIYEKEAQMIENPDEKLEKYIYIAKQVTEKIKKPDECTRLWEIVLSLDPGNQEALKQLVPFYERDKQWEKLSNGLEKLVDAAETSQDKITILQKLGVLYGDKIQDDRRAVDAWKRFLQIVPEDKRAQEQLKKRYINLKDWDELATLFEEGKKWDEFIRILEKESEIPEVPVQSKIDLNFRLATIWREKLDKVDRAVKYYEKVLLLDPSNFDATVALIPIYESANNFNRLVDLYQIKLKYTDQHEEKWDLDKKIAEINKTKFKNLEEAFKWYKAAFEELPDLEENLISVETMAEELKKWEEVEKLYKDNLSKVNNDIALNLRLAKILDLKLDKKEESLEILQSILKKEKDNKDALDHISQLYDSMGKYDLLKEIYLIKIELAFEPAEKIEIYRNLGSMLVEKLENIEDAIENYKEILKINPEDEGAYESLDKLYIQTEKWDELEEILKRRIEISIGAPEQVFDIKFRLGKVREEKLSNISEAIESYKEILEVNPDYTNAIEALEGILSKGELKQEVCEILEPVYEVRGDWKDLIRIEEELYTIRKDKEEKLNLLVKIANVYKEQLADIDSAFSSFSRAFNLDPENEQILQEIYNISDVRDNYSDLASLLCKIASNIGENDINLSKDLWKKSGIIYEQKLHDISKSIESYNQILKLDPEDMEAIEALERLYNLSESWTDLINIYKQKIELLLEQEEKISYYKKIATIYDEMLEKPENAVGCFQEILSLDPSNMDALQSLDRIYNKLESWSDLADIIQQQLSLATDVEKVTELQLRLANLRKDKMKEIESSLEIYREILERDSTNKDATEELEKLLNTEYQNNVAELLEPIYQGLNEWEKLVNVYEIQIKHREDPYKKVELFHKIAELYEIAGDNLEKAFQTYVRALEEDPSDAKTQEKLDKLSAALNNYPELISAYEGRIKAIENPDLAIHYHSKIARLYEVELNQFEGAINHWLELLKIDPSNMDALDSLERIYQQSEKYEELAAVYINKSGLMGSIQEQKQYICKAGEVYETILENKEKAIDVYLKGLEIDEDDINILNKLEQLYLQLDDWKELQNIYNKKADLVDNIDDKKEIYYIIGAIYENNLGQLDKAIDTYQKILEFDPGDLQALQRLDTLYQQTEQWHELLSILEREVELVSDPDEVCGLKFRIGRLWENYLKDYEKAVETYKEIIDISPTHSDTIVALDVILHGQDAPIMASEVLEPLYKEMGEWDKLINVYEVQISHNEDKWQRVQLLIKIANLQESDLHLDKPLEAFKTYSRALCEDPVNEDIWNFLENIAEKASTWSELAQLFEEQFSILLKENEDTGINLGLRLSSIYEGKLGLNDKAIIVLEKIIEVSENIQAIDSLDRLYQLTENWLKLTTILRKKFDLAVSPDEALEIQFRLAQVYQLELNDILKSIDCYKEILAANPDHESSLTALEMLFSDAVEQVKIAEVIEPLYRMKEQWDKLVRVYETLLEYVTEIDDKIDMIRKISDIYENRLVDDVSAFNWIGTALQLKPVDEELQGELERLGEKTNGWEEAINVYSKIYESESEQDIKKLAVLKMGLYFEQKIHDMERAEQSYRAVLDIDGHEISALQALDNIYTQYLDWEKLAIILQKRIEIARGDEDMIELIFRLGNIYSTELGQIENAIKAYRQIVDIDHTHIASLNALEEIYFESEDWPSLYEILGKKVEVVYSESEQADLYAKMAEIASEALENYFNAIELWKKVLEIKGDDIDALGSLSKIYLKLGNWRDLVDILDRQSMIVDDDSKRAEIYVQLGTIWGQNLKNDRNAMDNWLRVLEIDPNNLGALQALAEIYEKEERWDELVDNLLRILEVGTLGGLEDEELKSYHTKLAKIYGDIKLDIFEAIEQWKKVIELDPKDLGAIGELERLYQEQGEWVQYVNILSHKANILDDNKEKINILLNQANVAHEQLNDFGVAAKAYESILDIDPLHDNAFTSLEKIYSDGMQWENLIQLYLIRSDSLNIPKQQVEFYHNIAEIYEKEMNNFEQAFNIMLKAFEKDYFNDKTAKELERLAGVTGKWNELLTDCNQALQNTQDRALQIELSVKVGRWYAELNRPDYAVVYYNQVLSMDPNNSKALGAVGDIYRRQGQWEPLVQILTRQSEVSRDPDEKKKICYDLGETYEEKLSNRDYAIKFFSASLKIDNHFLPALEALERLYKDLEKWNELVEVLKYKSESLENPEEILETKLTIGEIYEEKLVDNDRAIAVFKDILSMDSTITDALKGLERIYSKQESWQNLYDIYEMEMEIVPTEREKVELLLRMAAMLEEIFLKPKQSAEKFEAVLDIDPANLNALTGLERLYRQLKQWHDLISTYERHIEATIVRTEKVDLYANIGEVYEVELKEPDRAIDAYRNILDNDDVNQPAMEKLARLYEVTENWNEAVEILKRLSEIEMDPDRKVELFFKIASILNTTLGNRGEAAQYFQSAIDLTPGYLPALSALRQIYYDSGDWLATVKILEQEQEFTENPQERSKLLYDLGKIHSEYLDDANKSIEYFEASISFDPENEFSGLPLVDVYVERNNWEPLEPILEMLIKKFALAKKEPSLMHKLWFTLGETETKLNNIEKALRAYKSAYEIDSTHLPTLKGLSALYYQASDWNNSFKYYKLILVNHKDSLSQDEVVDIFYKLGNIKLQLGERRNALNMFDKALEIDSHHRPTIEALVDMNQKQGNWDQVIHNKRIILEIATEEEKFEILLQLGDIAKDKLQNISKAIEFYTQALEKQPQNHILLHKLLELYTNTKQWHEAIEIIDRVSALEENTKRLSKYHYSVAVIYRDEIKDPEKSIEYFNKSLDADGENLKAFEAIDKILTQQKNWKEQERNYRKMLHRIKGMGKKELEVNLWHFLGEIYRTRLKLLEPAAEAFKMASMLEPEEPLQHEILATLYEQLPEKWEDAVNEYQWLIRKEPYKTDYYKALRRIYFDTRQYDKAWCLCATLTFLKKADDEEKQFFERYRTKGLVAAKARLDNEKWIKELFHPEEDVLMGKIFEIILRSVRMFKIQPPKAYGLKKKDKQELMNSTITFVRMYAQVLNILNIPLLPELYLRQDQPIGLQYAITDPPASVVGANLLSGFSPQDLAFIIAKHLSYYRPEHYIRWVEPVVSNLRLLILAALKIALPKFQTPSDPSGTLQETIDILNKNLQPAEREQLVMISQKFIEKSQAVDVKRWARSVELTSLRTGFLLTNDLEIAARIINTESMQVGEIPPSEKIKELVFFSVSEEYFKLRNALGISIGQ